MTAIKTRYSSSWHGRNLELDGYCAELGLAFEHQGLQHYEPLDVFHQTWDDVKAYQQRDALKRKLCEVNQVELIEIEAVGARTPLADLRKTIIQKCKTRGLLAVPKSNP